MARWSAILGMVLAASAAAQPDEKPNGILLIAKPDLIDPNFRETVVLVTQTSDFSTFGVILNRPTQQTRAKTGERIYFGGPVMRDAMVALFRPERAPDAPAFHVLKGIYLTMDPGSIEALPSRAGQRYRLYAGFSGWAPRQLESEIQRDGWYVLPANEELVFRKDTAGMWRELVEKARGGRARSDSATRVAVR